MTPKQLAFLLIIACLVMFGGCASLNDMNRMESFNDTVKTYEKMIFWSEFDAAAAFKEPGKNGDDDVDMDALKEVRVTSYKVRRLKAATDKSQVQQLVEIRYYRMDDVTVKTLDDNQLWVYDTDAQRWYLRSELPAFE